MYLPRTFSVLFNILRIKSALLFPAREESVETMAYPAIGSLLLMTPGACPIALRPTPDVWHHHWYHRCMIPSLYNIIVSTPTLQQSQDHRYNAHLPRPRCFVITTAQSTASVMIQARGGYIGQETQKLVQGSGWQTNVSKGKRMYNDQG